MIWYNCIKLNYSNHTDTNRIDTVYLSFFNLTALSLLFLEFVPFNHYINVTTFSSFGKTMCEKSTIFSIICNNHNINIDWESIIVYDVSANDFAYPSTKPFICEHISLWDVYSWHHMEEHVNYVRRWKKDTNFWYLFSVDSILQYMPCFLSILKISHRIYVIVNTCYIDRLVAIYGYRLESFFIYPKNQLQVQYAGLL